MIKVEHKDGETNVKISGRRGKDTANQMLENAFRRARMSEEEIEK